MDDRSAGRAGAGFAAAEMVVHVWGHGPGVGDVLMRRGWERGGGDAPQDGWSVAGSRRGPGMAGAVWWE
jgi:hypothetical protein